MDHHSLILKRIEDVSPLSLHFELEKASSKYHFLAAWIAIIFNPIFGTTDFFNIHDKWQLLMIIRLTISVITLITLMVGRKREWPSYSIVLVPLR